VTRSHPGLGQHAGSTLDEHLAAWNETIEKTGTAPWLSPWLARNRPEVPPPYQLVHGDPNRGNTFLQSDGRAVLIDLGAMQFGLAPPELVYLLLNYCNRDAARRSRFLDVYRKQLGNLFDTWESHGAFWLVAGFLERARWRVRSAGKRRHARRAASRMRRAIGAVEHAGQLARLFPDGRGDLQLILAHCWETTERSASPDGLASDGPAASPARGHDR
jgi:aminoglycoside phosphotransferase (APT) family kinase protein